MEGSGSIVMVVLGIRVKYPDDSGDTTFIKISKRTTQNPRVKNIRKKFISNFLTDFNMAIFFYTNDFRCLNKKIN